MFNEPKSVNIKKAANGFVISTYTNRGEAVEVAKTLEEANKIAKRILRGKTKPKTKGVVKAKG